MQVKMTLIRLETTDKGIFGHLTTDNGFDCVTLERDDIEIPCGTFKVTLYMSPKHGLVPLLHDVPGREYIEIHEGNWERDSQGCILVGNRRVGWAIENSKSTLKNLVEKLKGADEISITVK